MGISYYLTLDSKSKLFIAVRKESQNISTKLSTIGDLLEAKLEPDEFHNSMVDVSKQIKNKSDSFELSQNVNNFDENVLGCCYYKKE